MSKNKRIYIDLSGNNYEKRVYGIDQWESGIEMVIFGLDVEEDAQVHFSFTEYIGDAKKVAGEVREGILFVKIPQYILEGESECCYPRDANYCAYAWICKISDVCIETLKKIEMVVRKRPKPEDYTYTEEEVKRYDQLEKKFNQELSAVRDEIPKSLSEMRTNAEHRTVSDAEKRAWNNKSEFSGQYMDLKGLPNIPEKTSDIINDSEFITKAVKDLENYYLKSQTYSQEEINQRLSAVPKFSIQPVDVLPTKDISATTVYLLKTGEEKDNLYTEFIYVNGKWEYLGKQTVDLSGYALKKDIPTKLSELEIDMEVGGGASSWNDFKDKPFYVEEGEEVLAETIVEMPNGFGEGSLDTPIVLKADEKYIVSYGPVDGDIVEYEVTSLAGEQDGVTFIILVDPNIINGNYDDATIPFFIQTDNTTMTNVANMLGTSPDAVKIAIRTAEIVHHLDHKYIKDMYYSEKIDKIESLGEKVLETNKLLEFGEMLNFVEGHTYRITINNIKYDCKCMSGTVMGMNAVGMGNFSLIDESCDNTGETFVFADVPDAPGCVILVMDSTTIEATIEIEHVVKTEVVHPIQEKYLPEIPTFNLVEMGLEAVSMAGGSVELEMDASAIMEDIISGKTIRFVISVDTMDSIASVTLISHTFAYMAGSCQCGVVLANNISVNITIYPASVKVTTTRLTTIS